MFILLKFLSVDSWILRSVFCPYFIQIQKIIPVTL